MRECYWGTGHASRAPQIGSLHASRKSDQTAITTGTRLPAPLPEAPRGANGVIVVVVVTAGFFGCIFGCMVGLAHAAAGAPEELPVFASGRSPKRDMIAPFDLDVWTVWRKWACQMWARKPNCSDAKRSELQRTLICALNFRFVTHYASTQQADMDQQTLVAALEQAALFAAQQQQMQGGGGEDMGRDMTSKSVEKGSGLLAHQPNVHPLSDCSNSFENARAGIAESPTTRSRANGRPSSTQGAG